ncbi:MAG: hypothetical protein AB2799_19015 [Candidatus Thiodiazotropha sp.]
MKIPEWVAPDKQIAQIGRHNWHVPRLIQLAKDLPVMDIPLDHLYVYQKYEKLTLREMVMHMKAVMVADLSKPIILDEDGEIMDGRHRIMKALLEGEETIKAVRFDENPRPCEVSEE